ncbi:hypothetical protein MRI28_30660 [Nocardiopsis dassonvillei]|uniref:hypothetical protein n=1 Tax=Nocardiopsis dassonvillei TaxID=2014 RepID=UPI00200FE579|nr:hypothetical protein [Nocardiopsis dassonvillei]MCK9873932.1 hypothetical protein [Nocardiopsis dassonvillei]
MRTPTPRPRLRLLLLDGSPGATALLLLAAHRALPSFDAVLVPDTGWYPASGYRALNRLRGIASAMGWEPVKTAPIAHRTLNPRGSVPLPLFTLHPDGTAGRLPQGCARSTAMALTQRIRHLLGYPRSTPIPDGIVAQCATGTGTGHAHPGPAVGPPFVRLHRPLVDLGWSAQDCRALLFHHGLAPDLSCTACPHRSNRSWARLRRTEPDVFADAVAVDALVRHGRLQAATHGMPPGTTFFLHPSRTPLDQVDLSADTYAASEGCVPWACHGPATGGTAEEGGIR